MTVQINIDAWNPGYGTALETGELGDPDGASAGDGSGGASGVAPRGDSTARLSVDVELPPDAWRPLVAAADTRAPGVVLVVDGVRRVDAQAWVTDDGPGGGDAPYGGPADGGAPYGHPAGGGATSGGPAGGGTTYGGLAASYAAGVARCDLRRGAAEVTVARIERGLFTAAGSAFDLVAGAVRYPVRRVARDDPNDLSLAVQRDLALLEKEVSTAARDRSDTDDDLLVIDGPLRGRAHLPRSLGYVKTHRVSYLPPELAAVVTALRPGQRCPVFLLGTSWQRYTWYLRLPGPAGSPWAGVVRVECSDELPAARAIELADLSAVTLPRFASTSYKDPRAPQNLTPIAGLERRLRGLLGDARLLYRALVIGSRRPVAAGVRAGSTSAAG